MTKLSVNINKVATLRNARGGNLPDVERFAVDCEHFGAQGITVHPRPDERHIRRSDVYALKSLITTEFNIEGNPTEEFVSLVTEVRPTQVTLVPDDPAQLTSNHGWDTLTHLMHLQGLVARFHACGIRVSIFVDADPEMVEYAKAEGEAKGLKVMAYAHVGSGGMHIHAVSDGEKAEFAAKVIELAALIYGKCSELGGSIRGEYGIGCAKKQYLGAEALEKFGALKAKYDPKGILNPGKAAD